jgi:seryl-tRNA synthetase
MSPGEPSAVLTETDPIAHVGPAIFRRIGVDGVYARTAIYEDVIERLGHCISGLRDPEAEVLRFPPVMSRQQLEKSGYLKSFPNLLGSVCVLHGEAEIRAAVDCYQAGGDWTQSLGAADLVLSPAACYPIYPLVAARGELPAEGLLFDVQADCFRREPSPELDRLQSFRMREFVRIGSPAQIKDFRDKWMIRAEQFAAALGLPSTLEVANDPFYGRLGRAVAISQRQSALKFELLIRYHAGARPTACMSFNYHLEHFAEVWNIANGAGELAHTSCVAFGIDRLAVALFCVHGVDVRQWPDDVRDALSL